MYRTELSSFEYNSANSDKTVRQLWDSFLSLFYPVFFWLHGDTDHTSHVFVFAKYLRKLPVFPLVVVFRPQLAAPLLSWKQHEAGVDNGVGAAASTNVVLLEREGAACIFTNVSCLVIFLLPACVLKGCRGGKK